MPDHLVFSTVQTVQESEETLDEWLHKRGDLLYLLHFDEPRAHARHYLGSTGQLLQRLKTHANGDGACLTRALWLADEGWRLAALFQRRTTTSLTLRALERLAKDRHNGAAYCPLCHKIPAVPRGTVSYPLPMQIISKMLRTS